MRSVDQPLDMADRHPALGAAGIPPAFDRFQDRLRPVAAKRVAHIDDQQSRSLAEPCARAIAGGRENLLVALGKEFVPDRFGHWTFFPSPHPDGFAVRPPRAGGGEIAGINYSGLLSTDRLRCDSRGPPKSLGGLAPRTRSGSPISGSSRDTSPGSRRARVRHARG